MSGVLRALARVFRREGAVVKPDPAAEPDRVADASDPAVALAMRIMAEEGAGSDEATLAEELAAVKAEYAEARDEDRPALMRQIAQLSMRQAIAREARKKFLS
ncbi:DUF1992 domain-containing protein [Pseudooceanicola nitratireducens]|uniref:DUF1992 domain-containing protein n=1 Tax=Pseudooceanicola nitratireducens TaxID=517719 RepID=UPI003513780C